MIRRALLAALIGSVAFRVHSETFTVANADRWGTPERIVLPDYPEEALKTGRKGYVDVTGVVTPLRELQVKAYSPDSPASMEFVAALKEVIRHWQFYTPIGPDCRPISELNRFRVWFEVVDGKPKISLSRGVAASSRRPQQLVPLRKSDPTYPYSMQQRGLQAYVYAGMRIGPEGDVVEVTTDVFPEQTRQQLEDFAKATRRALEKWKFPANAERESRMACTEVFFHFRD